MSREGHASDILHCHYSDLFLKYLLSFYVEKAYDHIPYISQSMSAQFGEIRAKFEVAFSNSLSLSLSFIHSWA